MPGSYLSTNPHTSHIAAESAPLTKFEQHALKVFVALQFPTVQITTASHTNRYINIHHPERGHLTIRLRITLQGLPHPEDTQPSQLKSLLIDVFKDDTLLECYDMPIDIHKIPQRQ
jgi:hypothetical protein